MQFPEQYEKNMKLLLGEEAYQAYTATFDREYYQGLRVNTGKISPKAFLKRWGKDHPQALENVAWCDCGFYLSEDTSVYSKDPDYFAGLYYLQEPSAMAPAAILPIEAGDTVLDLCAAPGGKSTYLSAKLQNTGTLFSNDISPSRAKALLKNLELSGATQAVVLSEAPYKLSKRFPAFFDKILVDAPCSGEGMFHKEPAIMKNWEQYGNEYYAKLQKEILDAAHTMLKPGGWLLYSTCTFAPMEDEQMVEQFLYNHADMSLQPIVKTGGMADGVPAWTKSGREDAALCARFFPHLAKGQGHFAALMQKSKDAVLPQKKGMQQEAAMPRRGDFSAQDLLLLENWSEESLKVHWQKTLPEGGFLQKQGTMLFYSPVAPETVGGLRVLRNGVLLGELKKDRFEPSQAYALVLKKEQVIHTVDFDKSDQNLIRYLKGETLNGSFEDGWNLILADGFPLGWAKAVHGQLKNKYLKGWKLS